MKNFPKPTDTIGGIEKIWFIPVDDIAALGDVILNELQNITFASGKEWLTLYGTFKSKEFSEQKKETKYGIRFERSLQLFYPGYSVGVIQQLEEMKCNRFLVAYKDNNGLYKIAGTLENPLNFTYKLSTGKSGSDAQGIEMEFYGNFRIRISNIQFIEYNDINYGYLYNFYAVSNANFSPDGWHVPTTSEWDALVSYVGSAPGGKLKEKGYNYWISPNTGAIDSFLFCALPGGYRHSSGVFTHMGTFDIMTKYGCWWTKTTYGSKGARYRYMTYNSDNVISDFDLINFGMSVRLVKDITTLKHGQMGSVVDYDGNVYKTICIGTQEWLINNYACTHLYDGTLIEELTKNEDWAATSSPALCAYNNNKANV